MSAGCCLYLDACFVFATFDRWFAPGARIQVGELPVTILNRRVSFQTQTFLVIEADLVSLFFVCL